MPSLKMSKALPCPSPTFIWVPSPLKNAEAAVQPLETRGIPGKALVVALEVSRTPMADGIADLPLVDRLAAAASVLVVSEQPDCESKGDLFVLVLEGDHNTPAGPFPDSTPIELPRNG